MSPAGPERGAYRALFEGAPVAIWEEDFSEVQTYLREALRDAGDTDTASWLCRHPEVIAECVRRVRVLHVNKLAREFYGASTEHDLISRLPELFDRNSLEIFRREITSFAEGQDNFEEEFSTRTLDGKIKFVRMNVAILPTPDGSWSRVVVTFVDLTERRELEAALRASEARLQLQAESLRVTNAKLQSINQDLEQFAYAAAHDLREPLRTISLYAQLLRRTGAIADAEPAGKAVQVILDNSHRMETLVHDLLTFARALESPQTDIPEPLDVRSAVLESMEALASEIASANARIEIFDLPPVRVHPAHLRQILQNLLSNALKYRSPHRQLEVKITGRNHAEMSEICITDNGIGISPDYHERIFGIFRRLHGREIEGNGIGLALCRKITQQYHGSIRVESQLDRGATFYFTLPSAA